MIKGSKMTPEARAKISASLAGNQYRSGIPHSEEDRAKIADGLRRAYAEGRHRLCANPQNLAAYNADLQAGTRFHPRRNPERDLAIDKRVGEVGAKQTAEEFGLTQSAVYYALKRIPLP